MSEATNGVSKSLHDETLVSKKPVGKCRTRTGSPTVSSLKARTVSYFPMSKAGTRPHTEQMLNESSEANIAQSRGLRCARCAPHPPQSPGTQCFQNRTHTSLSTHFSATILQLPRCHLASPLSHFRCYFPGPALCHYRVAQS